MNIIDQQRIHRAVVAFEFFNGVILQRLDHVLHKAFRVHIDHFGIGLTRHDAVAYRMQQVRFTQAGTAIQEQWVISAPRIVCHLPRRSTSQLVRLTLNEVIEGVLGVDVGTIGQLRRRCRVVPAWAGRRSRAHHRGYRSAVDAGHHGLAEGLCQWLAAHLKTQQRRIRTAEIIQQAIDIV
ncbi:hypothetical protein D3C79_776410 [compost metagenome]